MLCNSVVPRKSPTMDNDGPSSKRKFDKSSSDALGLVFLPGTSYRTVIRHLT